MTMRAFSTARRGSVALWAASAALMFVATACAEDPVLYSSNRGSGSRTTVTSVENAHIVPRFIPGRCSIQVGGPAALRFTVTNNRPTGMERLLAISTEAVQTVHYPPQAAIEVPAGGAVAFGQPHVEQVAAEAVSTPAVELEGLDGDARPGTSVEVTFRFERLGDVDTRVPIETCPAQG
jgi:hypothetical protein